MRKNYETLLIGSKVLLVPYRPEHVENYHEWMKSPFLLEMTASEPLSLEEEIKMQLSWRDDSDKCTFIVLARSACSTACTEFVEDVVEKHKSNGDNNDDDSCSQDFDFVSKTLDAMVGDVNLFLSEIEEEYNEDEDQIENVTENKSEVRGIQAELDVMIAEENFRKMGMGKEASLMMMMYGAQCLGIQRFVVKIKEDNIASRSLFEKLGFRECNYAACFQEYELELQRSSPDEMVQTIQTLYGNEMCQTRIK